MEVQDFLGRQFVAEVDTGFGSVLHGPINLNDCLHNKHSRAQDVAISSDSVLEVHRRHPHRRHGRYMIPGMKDRASQWGWRRALYWQIMHGLATRLGFRIHYVTIGSDRPTLRLIYRDQIEIPHGYSIRWGCKTDFLPAVGKLPDVDQEFVDDAFERGDECVVIYHGDEIVNYCFCTRSWARVTAQLRVNVPKGFRYVYKDWTHPNHRRKHLSALNAQFRNLTRQAPFEERSLSYVETHNYPSLLRTYRHPNERGIRCGLVGWFTLFGRQVPFASRHARWIGFAFSQNPFLD